MFWMIMAIIVLIVGLFNVKRINAMFDKPTVEELENYQESVILHIDEEVSNFKKDIKKIYNDEGKPMVAEIQNLINILDDRILEVKEIENRIDKKLVKMNDFRSIM